jgi:HEAT repeat protein
MNDTGGVASRLGGMDALAVLSAGISFLVVLAALLGLLAAFLRMRNAVVARRWARVEQRWHDLLLQVLAGTRPAAELHASVRRGEERYLLELVSRYARRLRGAERSRCAEAARPYLPLLVKRARHRDAGLRAQAVHSLGLMGMDRHAAVVCAALDDRSEFVGMTAMRALARPEHAAHRREIVARLDRFGAWDASFVASIVAAIGPAVSAPLLEVLGDDSRAPRVRRIAAESLRRLNYLPAGTVAARVAAGTTDRDLVAACLRLLEAVGHAGCLPVIRPLTDSADAVIRQQAVRALGTLEAPAGIPLLVKHLDDPSPWVAIEAGRALARFEGGRLLAVALAGSGDRAAIAAQALKETR